jgi:SAM-dependent methyltransferase
VDVRTVRDLTSPAGEALLMQLSPYDGSAVLATAERLRRHWPAELVAAAMTQARLRARAATKFGADAGRMLLTPAGLEQATRASVAAHRAQRFVGAGVRTVADLCAGIGGDAVALARAGVRVTAVELDAVTAAVLRANVAALGLGHLVEVVEADATRVGLASYDAVFCDPARRTARGRVFDPRSYAPPWSFVEHLLAGAHPTGVKVAPGIPHDLVPAGVEVEWVSDAGDVKEAVLWSGRLSSGVRRRATLLPSGATLVRRRDDEPTDDTPPVGPPGRFLYEPDGAVIRAGLVADVARRVGGRLVDPTIAYVTADRLVPTSYATAYEVLEVLPFGLKPLRAALRARGVGRVVVKKRGTAVDPDDLRRRLRLGEGGGKEAVVVLTRVAGVQTALMCTRVPGARNADEPG